MSVTLVLLKKELKSIFSSWIAYATLIVFTFLNGVNFYISMKGFITVTTMAASPQQYAEVARMNLVEHLIIPFYNQVFVLLWVIVPAITMRLFAEEKKQRTEELLLTSPIRVGEIVLAKYLAAITLITLMLIPVAMFPAIVIKYSPPGAEIGPMFTGYLGLFLLGYALAAIGLFASTLTENQLVAFIIALAIQLLFFIVSQATLMFDLVRIGEFINLGAMLKALSITDHFDQMVKGLLRASDFVYFASLIGFWLWVSRQSVESARQAG